MLVPFALLVRRHNQLAIAAFLLGLLITCIGIIYRLPFFYDAANHVPILRLERNERLIFVVEFALGLLAALGLDGIWHTAQRHWWRVVRCLGGSVLALALLSTMASVKMYDLFHVPRDNPGVLKTWQDALARGNLLLLVYAAILLVAVVLWRRRQEWGRMALTVLPVVLVFDLVEAHSGYNPTVQADYYYPSTPEIRFLQEQPELSRFIASGAVMLPNMNLMYDKLSDFRGYDTLMPSTYQELGSQIDNQVDVNGPRPLGNIQSRILNFLNVRYLLTYPGDTRNSTGTSIDQDANQESHPGGLQGIVGPIFGNVHPGQTLKVVRNGLHQVTVLGATYARPNAGQLIFHLKSAPDAPNDLATAQVEVAKLTDNSNWEFNFLPIEQSGGRSFYFYLEASNTTEDKAVTVYYSPTDQYPDGTRTFNGQPVTGDLVFSTQTEENKDGPPMVLAQDGENRITILENRRVLPRAWLTHRVEVQPNVQDRLRRLQADSFDPARTTMLNEPLPPDMALPSKLPTKNTDLVSITSYQPEQVEITATSKTAGLLVLADQAFPGWNAYVDDTHVPIFTANHAIRAVYLPGGAHKIRFEYRPISFVVGASVTIVSMALLTFLALRSLLITRRRRVLS